MVREKRNKEKLTKYYDDFIKEGIMDPNVHPWVAVSWQRSRQGRLSGETISRFNVRLNKEEMAAVLKKHAMILDYFDDLYKRTQMHFDTTDFSMLLVDEDGYIIKQSGMPFLDKQIGNILGLRVLEEDIGTTSISIVMEHGTPFLMFGPEIWKRDFHHCDSCTAPIFVNGKLRYTLTFFINDNTLSHEIIFNYLQTLSFAMEQHLEMLERWAVNHILMDNLMASVFWIDKNYNIKYCNDRAAKRMEGKNRLQDVFINYEHIPIKEALAGQGTINRELAWITPDKTYEDITSVMPIVLNGEVVGALISSVAIEDLKTAIAHAETYPSRYSLHSMVGESPEFLQMQHKAMRLAKINCNMLLQGEPGTGKQRLAHGIHQASPRAASPLICIKCSSTDDKKFSEELFGGNIRGKIVKGKLEIAKGGTLFLDEVEKLSVAVGDEIANWFENNKKEHVRLIVACDSNLKRLTDKGLFSRKLYEMVERNIMRVPPLRSRNRDVEILANHILAEMSSQYNLPPKRLTTEALNKIASCSWLGNIKQLQGVIEQAFFHTASSLIDVDNINLPTSRSTEKSWKKDREAFLEEWRLAGGNVTKIAAKLAVSRVTLYRYLEKYGLRN